MTLPALATFDDLEVRLGEDEDVDVDVGQAEALLAQASVIVRKYARRTWVDEEGHLVNPLPDGVAGVVVEMVHRVLTNPDGAVQVTDTAGPFTLGANLGANASDRLYLTWADKLVLTGAGRSKAATVDTTPPRPTGHDLAGAWVNGPCGLAPDQCD